MIFKGMIPFFSVGDVGDVGDGLSGVKALLCVACRGCRGCVLTGVRVYTIIIPILSLLKESARVYATPYIPDIPDRARFTPSLVVGGQIRTHDTPDNLYLF